MKDYNYWRQRHLTFFHDLAQAIVDDTKNMTPIEGIVYFVLKNTQNYYGLYYFSTIPQYKIKNYKVDFMVMFQTPGAEEKRVVIECDGHNFHEKTKEQASKDKLRDRELQKLGYTVLRYSGSDIVNDPSVITKDLESIFGLPEWVNRDERSVSNK